MSRNTYKMLFRSNHPKMVWPLKALYYKDSLEFSSFSALLNANRNRHRHTNHWVVACADKAHHLNVCRYGRRTGKLCIGVHTAHGIGHAVGCRTSCHIVRMQGTARAAAGCNGEVFLTLLNAFLLVGTCYRMLESGWVGGVAGDGYVNTFLPCIAWFVIS